MSRVFLVIKWLLFSSCKIISQFAGSRLHLCSSWFTATYCPHVEKQVTRQFKYYWLIDWILLVGGHVVMKDQSFVVFRILTLAVRDSALFSCYRFSVCYHEVLNLWWVFAICYKYILRLLEKYTIINLKGFCKTWTVTKMQIAICFFPKPETDSISIGLCNPCIHEHICHECHSSGWL